MNNHTFNNYVQHEELEWTCLKCALVNISTSLLNTSESSTNTIEADQPVEKIKPNQLRIACCNFQSIWNKKAELKNFLYSKDIDILIGSETHLSCNISNAEIIPPNYCAARKDRKDGYGGVVIIYKDTFIVEEIHHKNTEMISIKLETHEKPVIVSSCYRPPNCSNEVNTQLTNETSNHCRKWKNHPIWIGGDFNLPDIDWESKSITSHKNSIEINELFIDTFENSNLVQFVAT
jgi:hypothetical protein